MVFIKKRKVNDKTSDVSTPVLSQGPTLLPAPMKNILLQHTYTLNAENDVDTYIKFD